MLSCQTTEVYLCSIKWPFDLDLGKIVVLVRLSHSPDH